LGGAQVCWATESSLLKEGSNGAKAVTAPAVSEEGRRRR